MLSSFILELFIALATEEQSVDVFLFLHMHYQIIINMFGQADVVEHSSHRQAMF